MEALHWTGKSPGLDDVKDISASGLYVRTNERWPYGQINPIKLTCEDIPADDSGRDVELRTRTVRWGEDGMGLALVLPKTMELWLWNSQQIPEPAEIVHEFRVARALAFLLQICPSASQELKLLFREGLSNLRIRHSIEIALKTEETLASDPTFPRMRASKYIVMKVAENGSWSESGLTRQFWAGLLALSCRTRKKDESLIVYLDILSQLATMQSLIFAAACTRAEKYISDTGQIAARPLICTADQTMKIAEAHDWLRIDRNLAQLCDLGLLEERARSKYFTHMDNAKITPTTLGLEMYARCQGHIGPVSDFYRLTSPGTPAPSDD